jgi:putative ABC transport system substrate-binding protein
MKRREFITLLGGAVAAMPLGARAQQATPKLGYLSARSSESDKSMLAALRRGLAETGFVDGQNVTIEARFAEGQYSRLTALAADLALLHVAVIAFGGAGATTPEETWRQLRAGQIPVVFNSGSDPVRQGLVASLNRPGGNMTGVASLIDQITAKNLGLLHDLVPDAKVIAVLADPNNSAATSVADVRAAAAAVGLQTLALTAGTEEEIDAVFRGLKQKGADAVLLTVSPFFVTRAEQFTALAARERVPAMYFRREFADAGGLISYGNLMAEGYRQMGLYAGRILKGEKASDLPVVQPTKFELVINLKTAKALGLDIPPTLLAIADEVIE